MRRRNLMALLLLVPFLRELVREPPKPEPVEQPLPDATVERVLRAIHYEECER